MGVVQLHRKEAGKLAKGTPAFFVQADQILHGGAGENVFLLQTQKPALVVPVVWVEHAGDVLRAVFVQARLVVFVVVEQRKVKLVQAFGLPQAQRADGIGLVAEDGHIVGHGLYAKVL